MKKLFAVIAAVLALGMVAGPAVADDAGVVILAQATVGKIEGAAPGCDDPTGAGIGLPGVNGVKKAFYRFTGTGTSATQGPITFEVCGQIDPVVTPAGPVGAACGMSSGNNGTGNAGNVSLSQVGWDASAATTFLVTGNASTPKGPQALFAQVTASGTGSTCAEKVGQDMDPNKSGGAQVFNVSLTYELLSVPAIKHTK